MVLMDPVPAYDTIMLDRCNWMSWRDRDQSDESFNLIFLDAERPQYTSYWNDIDRVLNTGGLLIVNNVSQPGEIDRLFQGHQ